MRHHVGFAAAAAAAVILVVGRASACGLTPPIGPNGLPAICHGDEDAPRFRLGLAVGGTRTRLNFSERKADLLQGASVLTGDLQLFQALTLSLTGGASLGGTVDFEGTSYDVRPGAIGGIGAAYRFSDREARWPFAQVSFTYSLSRATARAPGGETTDFEANDWRAGLAVGKVLGGWAAPFVVGRYFGGGTRWSVAGGKGRDDFRYHVGVGSAFALSRHVDLLAEFAFLGEQRATLGAGYTF